MTRKLSSIFVPLLMVAGLALVVGSSLYHLRQPGLQECRDLYNRPKWWQADQSRNFHGWEIRNKKEGDVARATVQAGSREIVLPVNIRRAKSAVKVSSEAYCINDAGVIGGKLTLDGPYYWPVECAVVWVPTETEGQYRILDLNDEFEGKWQALTSVRSFDPRRPELVCGYLEPKQLPGTQFYWAKLHGLPKKLPSWGE